MKQPIPILALAATAAAFSTGCLSVTGFDAPCPARAVEDSLRISVAAQAAEKDAETLAQDIKIAASQNIARRGFRLIEGENPDVTVSFDASQKEYNRAGDFIVYDGRVDARIVVPWSDHERHLEHLDETRPVAHDVFRQVAESGGRSKTSSSEVATFGACASSRISATETNGKQTATATTTATFKNSVIFIFILRPHSVHYRIHCMK